MNTQNNIVAADKLLTQSKIFACLFADNESQGTCTVEAYQSASLLLEAFDDIRKNKREAVVLKGSDAPLRVKDGITISVDFETAEGEPVESAKLSGILKELGISPLTI